MRDSSKNEAIGALSSGWRLVNWRSLIETSAKREDLLADGFAMLVATTDPAMMPKLRDDRSRVISCNEYGTHD